jgi:hypothetical protein
MTMWKLVSEETGKAIRSARTSSPSEKPLSLVPRRRILFNYLADVRLFALFNGVAFAGHTGSAVAADFFIPSHVRVIFADPPDAATDWAIRVCHHATA